MFLSRLKKLLGGEKKEKMKTRYIIAPIVMLAILIALSTPAMAGNLDELETRCWNGDCLNGTITNGTVIVLCNMTGLPTVGNWTFTLPSGTVDMAYVHWHRWGACHGTAITAEFWNGTGAYESIGFPYPGEDNAVYEDHGVWWTDYNPRHGNHHYYWKVNASEGTNTFNATGCYPTPGEHCDARWFIAVINNTGVAHRTHDGHWWHNTGYKKTQSAADEQETWYYNASNNPINTSANYTLWTAQSHYDNSNPPIEFNGHQVGTVGSDCACHGDGQYADFSLCEFNVPSNYIEADGSQKVEWKYNNDAYYVNFGTLAEVLPKPDLVITDIKPNETMMRANTNYKINATVKNKGSKDIAAATDFNLSLYVNGTYHNKTTVSGGLAIGASKEKTFALTVNLPKGCHNFTVVADCDANVAESDETNNATTEFYQVGYVLVVEKNGDFGDLVTESENGAFGEGNVTQIGNTYYIRNFTGNYGIQNCAGCGISIKDTTSAFVIQNCTVHDCAYEGSPGDPGGICLDNVTSGTIGNYSTTKNTIENNTNAGIRVKNSTYVNITDNTIKNNTVYGIYAYPRALPATSETRDDCKYVNVTNNTVTENEEAVDLIAYNCTVKNNTITDNTKFGIYMMGNYSNITDNNITDNTDYGVKLYNCTDNYVYCNNFTDNNVTYKGHQAWDNRNTNYWNTTEAGKNYTGNRWKDWQNNSGFPCNYSIDGGSNKDKRPKGLYDFLTGAGDDKWAYEGQVSTKPPDTINDPTGGIGLYSNIDTDDGTYEPYVTESDTYFAAQRFNFSIAENVSKITKINITWNGRGWYDKENPTSNHGSYLYIWKNDTGYDPLANNAGVGVDATLTGEVTSDISSYINSGNMTVLVVQNTAQETKGPNTDCSNIATDYVRVSVCVTP